jgi:hypothetical protein
MRPERRCKSGMDGGLTAASLVQPAALSKNGRFFVQPTRTTSGIGTEEDGRAKNAFECCHKPEVCASLVDRVGSALAATQFVKSEPGSTPGPYGYKHMQFYHSKTAWRLL